MKLFIRTTLFFALLSQLKLAAQDIPIGEWRAHLPFHKSIGVAEAGSLIYCATEQSLFSYNKADNSIQRMSKVDGLSDVGISAIGYNESEKAVLVAYSNTNIDIITDKGIFNVSDIKRKTILGLKSINSVMFIDKYAYLSCGFGIVVLDMDKKEIKDTYFIGREGAQIEVFQIATDGSSILAATEQGIYTARLNNPNLADFNSWSLEQGLPDGKFRSITFNNNKFYSNFEFPNASVFNMDTIFVKKNGTWEVFNHAPEWRSFNLVSSKGKLLRCGLFKVFVYDQNDALQYEISLPNHPQDALLDSDNEMWIADKFNGLVHSADRVNHEMIIPNGPGGENTFDLAIDGDKVWVAAGGRDGPWAPAFINDGISNFIEGEWSVINDRNEPIIKDNGIQDILTITMDPDNTDVVYGGSWGDGLLKFNKGKLVEVYNDKNSILNVIDGSTQVRIGGVDYDQFGNLWMSNSRADGSRTIVVKRRNGTWDSYSTSGTLNNISMGELMVDQFDQKWILLKSNGILVFDDRGTTSTSDDIKKVLSPQQNQGNIPNKNVNCIVEDLDGEVWIGTNEGIGVFYSPELVLSGTTAGDAQTILVEKDGFHQPLFGFEVVTALAVDGANRKWVGTQSAGVFLMSEDGTQELLNFREDNSPLFSNNISSIAVNGETGEVFFGTEKGLISYRGTATEGGDVFESVYAYPNPVRPEYDGVIAIKGLVRDADVKITDIGGTLIYKTIAEGGQATWDGKNFSGEKAHTGVYLVFASNEDGSQTIVTKILFVN